MHSKNKHHSPYNFDKLCEANKELSKYVKHNPQGNLSIDFSDARAVLELNRSILIYHYELKHWDIPEGYLCPPIPGRADYIHHIADLLQQKNSTKQIVGLDIGVGANCIYSILASQIYNWKMVGTDINETAIASAKNNIALNPGLENNIEIRHQTDNAFIFQNILRPNEYYDFTICNPPFHASEKDAMKGTLKKLTNLRIKSKDLNFGGQANELWCNGGEALFIKRMIKQSINFKKQVGWFTSLVSKKDNLPKIHKQLQKLDATHKTIKMSQGNKQSRFVAWKFNDS
ncbi:23S rRNA (adenine(1618)-N(6))-methyltransferase RlmF [Aquimarina litoralis]|uniref:23S rRNA (adenine(1618)-N(6))-methyltransferase RlmF n=1 Tax=Aquimarina litoralis TaxID=584605 RepID=UPI001C594783|nr:23S rRNA (adenine(1618)-N(6))-methyltransferase RlmF [Aquimarina litoralis]MBW1296498.1 23S rRNA (adenine(1618)-N(6))-methyltransferase RlmF [Aquimarina litoralis]